jgi:hypothetical protein
MDRYIFRPITTQRVYLHLYQAPVAEFQQRFPFYKLEADSERFDRPLPRLTRPPRSLFSLPHPPPFPLCP